MELQKLIKLNELYRTKADIQAERGNFEEAKAYDDLAHAIDLQILDAMVDEQNARIKLAIVA
jgi:hypothetical protein